MAGGALGRGVGPAPSDAPPSAPLQPTGSPVPTVPPSVTPTGDPSHVDLENVTDHAVSVVIDDETGRLVDAASGRPGDGMSVRWFDSIVENVAANSIRIVWVGLPRDEDLRLSISLQDGVYRLGFVQDAPPAYSDAIGHDRVLVLEFDTAVDAENVKVTFAD